MKQEFEKNYIVTDATGADWFMHKQTKEVYKGKQSINELTKLINDNDEYMIVRDYKDEKECEFSILVKHEDDYYFVTNTKNFI